jgi:hypothetical protein
VCTSCPSGKFCLGGSQIQTCSLCLSGI